MQYHESTTTFLHKKIYFQKSIMSLPHLTTNHCKKNDTFQCFRKSRWLRTSSKEAFHACALFVYKLAMWLRYCPRFILRRRHIELTSSGTKLCWFAVCGAFNKYIYCWIDFELDGAFCRVVEEKLHCFLLWYWLNKMLTLSKRYSV